MILPQFGSLVRPDLALNADLLECNWASIWSSIPLAATSEARSAALELAAELSAPWLARPPLSLLVGFETVVAFLSYAPSRLADFCCADSRIGTVIAESFGTLPKPLRPQILCEL